jgi:hypothetical protein
MHPRHSRRPLTLLLIVAVGLTVAGCGVLGGARETVLPTDGAAGPTVVPSSSATAAPAAPTASASVPSTDDAAATDCAGAPVTLSGADLDFTLTGDCPAVTVAGTGLDIEAGAATIGSLQLSGDRNELEGGTLQTLAVDGQDNEVDVARSGALTVNGDRNEVTASDEVGAVTVSGNDNRVLAPQWGPVSDNGQRNQVGAG